MHPGKIFLKILASGVDLLGWTHFPAHRVLRSATKRRMVRRIKEHPGEGMIQSYLGMLTHGNAYELQEEVMAGAWLYQNKE